MHYVRGIRTRALRKRHSASFLAAARRLLQSIKTADQGCFAKDKNESLFLRQRQEIRTTAVRISCFFRFWKGFKRVGSRLVTRDLYFTKKTSHLNKTERKTLRRKKRRKTQNIADERRITGRFAKRFSGERSVSLGFELTFLSEFREFVWRVLDRDAKRRACIVKHPPKCHYCLL